MEPDKVSKRRSFIINVIYFALVAALFFFTVKYALGWLMPFLIGFVVAMVFRPVIYWAVDRLRLGRKLAAVLVVLLGYAVLCTLLVFLGMELISALGKLFSSLPSFFTSTVIPALSNLGDSLETLFERMPEEWVDIIDTARSSLTTTLTGAVTSVSKAGLNAVAGLASGLPGFFIALIFTILSSFFISQDYYGVTRFITAQFPERFTKVLLEAKSAIAGTVGAYIKAYAKIMGVTFVELTIGFLIIGIKNPLPVALGIAFFDILPVFGTGGIIVPWIVIDLLLGNFSQALGLLIIYGVITVVRNFIEPKIVGDQLGLNPIVSIIAIYLGFRWFGVLGMIIMPASVALAMTLHSKGVITLYKRPDPIDEDRERERRAEARSSRAASRAAARDARRESAPPRKREKGGSDK